MVDHTKRLGLLSRDGLASKEHFPRFSHTHFPWMSKVLHPIYAEGHNRIGKPSILACNHQIKRPHQHQPASDDPTLNLNHGWFGDISPSPTETQIHLFFIRPMPFDTRLTKPAPGPHRRLGQWFSVF